jgi:peptide/nickel transport system substrate-binding protein
MKYKFLQFLRYLFSVLFGTWLLVACQKSSLDEEKGGLVPAKGDRYYGGVFTTNETEYIKTLFPHSVQDVYSYRVASQIYEGLYKFDPVTLKAVPCLAEDTQIDSTRTLYTIKIKKGVFFHDDPCFEGGKGRELKAQDVAYCFTRLATRHEMNRNFSVIDDIIVGAREHYQATQNGIPLKEGVSGIRVIDDYTIQFQLVRPNALFLSYLARPEGFIFPREAFEKYGKDLYNKAVGTGAFILSEIDENVSIILKRNPNYHQKDSYGNQLPYLDAIKVKFIKDKKTELFEFKKDNLDMVYRLPTDYIVDILSEQQRADGSLPFALEREPEMQTQLIVFMNQDNIFKNPDIRKAFSYAINRERIKDLVLGGEAYDAGRFGITPPSFKDKGYFSEQVRGFEFNPDTALLYLQKAGYPNGKGFPATTLYFNPEGDRNTQVVSEIKTQLKNTLNIDIEIAPIPHAQLSEKAQKGDFQMLRLSWIADFPSPEAFLRMLYSEGVPTEVGQVSYPNIARYRSPAYDRLYQQALNADNEQQAYQLLMKAESVAMEEAPVLVLWYDEGYRLLKPHVRNFPNNPMQYRDFSQVYLVPLEKKGDKRTAAAL